MSYKKPKTKEGMQQAFAELCTKPAEEQQEFFLKSFIFALGDDWKLVPTLGAKYRKYLAESGEGEADLNEVQAADFLQKNGLTRTAVQRKNEIKDIDLDDNKRISLVEYLLLHFKPLILREYYKRKEMKPPMKLDKDSDVVGLTGVGDIILDELFSLPVGIPPELEEAIEQFTATVKKRENRLNGLRKKAAAGGVKGMAAKNEIIIMEKEDMTDMNRLELTLNAAKKKASKTSSVVALQSKKKKLEEEEKQKKRESRRRLKEKASLWENN